MCKNSLKIQSYSKILIILIMAILILFSICSIKMLIYKTDILINSYKQSSLGGNLIARNLPDIGCIIMLSASVVTSSAYLVNKKIYLFFTTSLLLFLCACMNIAEDLFLISPVNNSIMGMPISESCSYYLITSIIFSTIGLLCSNFSKLKIYVSYLLILILIIYSFKSVSTSIAGILIFILELYEKSYDKKVLVYNMLSVLNSMVYPLITIYLIKIGNYKYSIHKCRTSNSPDKLKVYTASEKENILNKNYIYILIFYIAFFSIIGGLLNLIGLYINYNDIIQAIMLPHSYKSFLNFCMVLIIIFSYNFFYISTNNIEAHTTE